MGQVTIKIPQRINRFYQVDDAEFGKELLRNLEDFEKETKSEEVREVIPPRRNSLKEDLASAVGIWADREESAEEIARAIRDKNNGKI